MAEVNAFGNEQSFDLVELEEMARVDRIAAIAFPGRDDRDRRSVLLHRANLHRRGVRSQQHRVGQPERVEAFARRMIARNVERVEVIVSRFRLGPDDDGKAVPREIGAAVLDDPAHGMNRAMRW